jgi:1-aminocyclopropane-1-carboxylate deaminase/D-cysteine desulfhydrase-like pyridoxal-dependent ACC family enzyme
MNDQGFSVRKVVVSVGSGISLAGILQGFAQASFTVPVAGVVVRNGRISRLEKRIDKWALGSDQTWGPIGLRPERQSLTVSRRTLSRTDKVFCSLSFK